MPSERAASFGVKPAMRQSTAQLRRLMGIASRATSTTWRAVTWPLDVVSAGQVVDERLVPAEGPSGEAEADPVDVAGRVDAEPHTPPVPEGSGEGLLCHVLGCRTP